MSNNINPSLVNALIASGASAASGNNDIVLGINSGASTKNGNGKDNKKPVSKIEQVNTNPFRDAIIGFYKLPKTKGKIIGCFDVSGSQDQSLNILSGNLDKCLDMEDILVYPFGMNFEIDPIDGIFLAYTKLTNYNCYTYINMILKALRYIETSEVPITLVIQGDGEFSGYNAVEQIMEALKKPMPMLQKVVVIFSPHTSLRTQTYLVDQFTQALGSNNSAAISFDSHLLSKTNYNDLHRILSANNSLMPSVPDTHIAVPDLGIAIHKLILASNLAKVIRKDYPHLIEKLMNLMLKMIKLRPEMLMSSPVWTKLHNTCKLLYPNIPGGDKSQYLQAIEDFKRNASPIQASHIKNLLEASFQDPVEVEHRAAILSHSAIASISFPHHLTDNQSILSAIRNGEPTFLLNILKTIVPTINQENKGVGKFFVLRPTASDEECRMGFASIFSQWGNFSVKGAKLYIMGLYFLGLDTQVPKILIAMLKKAFLGNPEYTKLMLGYEEGSLTLNPMYMGFTAIATLHKAFQLYKEEMFGNITPEIQAIIDVYSKCYKVHLLNAAIQKLSNEKVHRVVEKVLEAKGDGKMFHRGDFVRVKQYPREPQLNLPSLARIISINRKGGIEVIKIEFLDRPIGTNDTHNVSPKGIELLLKGPLPQDLITKLNEYLIKMQKLADGPNTDDTIDLPSHVGMGMKDPLNPELLEQNWGLTMNFIKINHNCEAAKTVKVDISATIPPKSLIKIVQSCVSGISDEFAHFLSSGANITMSQIIDFSQQNSIKVKEVFDAIDISFNHNGEGITLTPDEISAFQGNIINWLRENITSGLVGSSLKPCSVCFDTIHARHMKQLACGRHWLCLDCFEGMNKKYSPGEQLLTYRHQCPECKFPQPTGNDDIDAAIKNTDHTISHYFCKNVECAVLFPYKSQCGDAAKEGTLLCPACGTAERDRIAAEILAEKSKDDLADIATLQGGLYKVDGIYFMKCPYCQTLISRSGGCLHMTCPAKSENDEECGGHSAWGYPDKKFDSPEAVYDFLSKQPGGIFGNDHNNDGYDDDYSDDEYRDDDI
jgi:hypothetical protein